MAIGFRAMHQAVRVSAMAVLLAMSISPALAIQDGSSPGLAITDSTGSRSGVFDAIVEPGGTATIPLQFRAGGDAPIAAESWIANATSAVNGGVLLSTREAALEGPATWLDLEVGPVTIEPDSPVERPVSIQVPGSAEPGVYIAGIVIQAMQPVPIPDSDTAQVIRGTALVAIQVPGDIEATFALDAPTLVQVEHGNVIQVGLANTGTVPVFPSGTLTLRDESGETVAEYPVAMGAVFAGTSTVLEVPLQPLPPAGTYTVVLSLSDVDTGATARSNDGSIVIPVGLEDPGATPAAAPGEAATPEPTQVDGLAQAEIRFEHASVRADGDPLFSVYVEASIANTGSPVESARLVLVAAHNGQVVEEAIVADRMSLATGVTSISTRYAPEDGFGTGIWTFSLRLETVGERGEVTVLTETGTVAKIDLS